MWEIPLSSRSCSLCKEKLQVRERNTFIGFQQSILEAYETAGPHTNESVWQNEKKKEKQSEVKVHLLKI